MPSLLHEALLLLFRNRPSLAAELMREALGEKLPPHDTAEIQEASLSQIAPTEYHADLVVLLRSNEPVFGIVVEVQLQLPGLHRVMVHLAILIIHQLYILQARQILWHKQ